MLKTIIIAAAAILILMALFAIAASFFGFPGIAGLSMGVAQLSMYALLIAGVVAVLIALVARWVKD